MNGKLHEISKIRVFFDSKLNFTITFFIWGLANDIHTCKKYYEKPTKQIILSNLI